MGYGDDWEREFTDRVNRWSHTRWSREAVEASLAPDERLDEVGWDIYYCATTNGMDDVAAAALALDGNLRQRLLVRSDLFARNRIALRRRYAELHPAGVALDTFETQAPEQLAFWRKHLTAARFVYFIQAGGAGPVKIGLTTDPARRLPQLQTGSHEELLLRHVVPGDLGVEQQLHRRFAAARIRGEWFGREYLPIILAFAGGLADRMIRAHDGSGNPPELRGGDVRSSAEVARLRRDIERLWLAGHSEAAIAELTWVDLDEVQRQLEEMRTSSAYDVQRLAGYDDRAGRIVPMRARRSRRAGRAAK